MSYHNRASFPLEWAPDDGETRVYAHQLMTGGRVTVCERLTGFGYWDTETGYRSPCGQFWLASGHFDIRDHLHRINSEEEMVDLVMRRANTCTGGRWNGQRVGVGLDYLEARENWRPRA